MSVDEAHRQPEYDVLQLVRTKGGWLAILHFKAYRQGNELVLNSKTWDGIPYEDEAAAEAHMQQLAAKHGIRPSNCCTELLCCDPLREHQFIVYPWEDKPFDEVLQNGSTRFDGMSTRHLLQASPA